MWDYVSLFLCAGDKAKCGACNSVNQIAIVKLHLVRGYEAHSDWVMITCIYDLNSYLISLIFMLILCEYDACYHNFYEFSLLVCHYTKVHIYA